MSRIKYLLITLICLIVPYTIMAQERSLEIFPETLTPVQQGGVVGVPVDKIPCDHSKRPCARIKMHINRMSREDVAKLSIKSVGGNIEIMRCMPASEGTGLIIELTAKPQTRFYLHHDNFGESNEVSLNLEGDKEYRLEAQLMQLQSIVISSNVIGADVYIDDVYRGMIDDEFTLTVNEITNGTHNVRIDTGTATVNKQIEVGSTNIHFRCNVDEAISQYVVFEVMPQNATVIIDGKERFPDEEGIVQTVLHSGTYSYTVSAQHYHTESGSFTVLDDKVMKSITLRAAHGWIQVTSSEELDGAKIYIDGTYIGEAPITSGMLTSGTHRVRIAKRLYKTLEEEITISDGELLNYAPTLIPDFANVTITVAGEAEIWVNGENKGISTWSGKLASGAYIFEARKAGHTTSRLDANITPEQRKQTFTLQAPTAIEGTLDITSSPAMATVNIDGKDIGTTPLKKRILVGNHKITVAKNGYKSISEDIEVKQGDITSRNFTLTKDGDNSAPQSTPIATTPRNTTPRNTTPSKKPETKSSGIRLQHGFNVGGMLYSKNVYNYDNSSYVPSYAMSLNYELGMRLNPHIFVGVGVGVNYTIAPKYQGSYRYSDTSIFLHDGTTYLGYVDGEQKISSIVTNDTWGEIDNSAHPMKSPTISVPIYLNLKTYLTKGNVAPYLSLVAGYSFNKAMKEVVYSTERYHAADATDNDFVITELAIVKYGASRPMFEVSAGVSIGSKVCYNIEVGYTGIMGYSYNSATTTVRHTLNSGIVFKFGVSFN